MSFTLTANIDIILTSSSYTHVYLWCADGPAGWVAATADNDQHIQVNLLTLHDVTKVVLQGSGKAANAWTEQFKVGRQSCVVYDLSVKV